MPSIRDVIHGPWRAVPVLGVTQIIAWGSIFYSPVLTMPLIAADHGWSGRGWELWQAFHAFVLLTSLAIAVFLTVYSFAVYLWEWRRLMREAVST